MTTRENNDNEIFGVSPVRKMLRSAMSESFCEKSQNVFLNANFLKNSANFNPNA